MDRAGADHAPAGGPDQSRPPLAQEGQPQTNPQNLTIFTGEVFGLLGPNGAGKTTTILMTLGLTEPPPAVCACSALISAASRSVSRRV